jgi:predicted choloylglycine hydrolase
MNLLKVKGSYYEMGLQQGEVYSNDIKDSFNKIIKSKPIKNLKPKLVPKILFSKILKYVVYKKWEKPIKILLPEYCERIKGIADGAKVKLSDLYIIQAIEVLADDVSSLIEYPKQISFGCSSICVLQNIIKSPQIVVGKNFDYISDFVSDNIVRFSEPKNGYKSIEVTYKQIAGSHDGMNEKGLVVLYNYGLSTEKVQTRVPITILVQQILERCSNIDEAITFIKAFRYPNGAILTLVDTTNRAICVEITPEHIGYRKPQDGVLVATNFYLSEQVKNFDIPHNAMFKTKGVAKELQGKPVHQSSIQRYNRITELVKKFSRVGIEEIKQILKDHNGSIVGNDDSVCRHSEWISTQVSMIFLPKQRKLLCAIGQPCNHEYVEFEL